MKANIHPNWNHNCQVTCACGNVFTTGSMQDTLTVDICSACHPFFTGEMKFVDRQGRVDKFMKKMQAAQAKQKAMADKKKTKGGKQESQDEAKTYKQLLAQQKTELKKSDKTE